jgi:O-acetyl-ADP-ribose deacetylase
MDIVEIVIRAVVIGAAVSAPFWIVGVMLGVPKIVALLTRRARIEFVQGDITTMRADAIVNAAKPSLYGGGGVDGAIHRAGGPAVLAECRKIRAAVHPGGLPLGHAVPTTAGNLPADYVIHTVGPDARIGETDPRTLAACYKASLKVADALKARVVSFPLISSGVYGWDVDEALWVAIEALTNTRTRVRTVRLVLFDAATMRAAQRIITEAGRHWNPAPHR